MARNVTRGGTTTPARPPRDESPAREAARSSAPRPSSAGRGRAAVRKHITTHAASDFADRYQVVDVTRGGRPGLGKFLDDDFFHTFYQHFINEFKGEKRQMTFACHGENEDGETICPLCEIGDSPAFIALINVLNLDDPRNPVNEVWWAGPAAAGEISDLMDALEELDPVQHANDTGIYFKASKEKQKSGFFGFDVERVKDRDLGEHGYRFDPFTEDELAQYDAGKFTEDNCYRLDTREKLQEIADELLERNK